MKSVPAFPPADRLHAALAERDIEQLIECWHEQISYRAPGARERGRSPATSRRARRRREAGQSPPGGTGLASRQMRVCRDF